MSVIYYNESSETIAAFRNAAPSHGVQSPAQYPTKTAKEILEPTFEKMVENFTEAMRDWKDAGFPIASLGIIAARRSVCAKCEFWDGKARLGLGKCNSPKCGCTRLKIFLQTSKCPENKWAE